MARTTHASIVLAAVSGLAMSASAQGVTLLFSADATVPPVGETVRWTVSAQFSGYADPTAYFGGFVGSFVASDSGIGTASNFQNLLSGEGTPQTANGASVDGVNIFNAALLGTDDQANPIEIFSFDVTLDAIGFLSYDAEGLVTVFPNDGVLTLGDEFTNFTVISDRIGFPTPGAGMGIALGGLMTTRRRRG
jgi:hypothetical protein